MTFVTATDAVAHQTHGATFTSYACSATGSAELCLWRTDVPAGQAGVAHRVSQEEVMVVASGALDFEIDGECRRLGVGDAAIVPAGAMLRLDNLGDELASAWVSTRIGLTAELPDGTGFTPPWAS